MATGALRRARLARQASRKAPSKEERLLESGVEQLLWEGCVLNCGGGAYGLKWRFGSADDPRMLTGGWLFQASRDVVARRRSRGKLAFFILDDKNRTLRQCKDETGTYTYRSISYDEVVAVEPRQHSASGVVYIKIIAQKGDEWRLTPIQSTNEDIMLRWAAALRHRCDLISDEMRYDRDQALKLALWIQSIVRMRMAIEKAERRRQRRTGLLNRLGGLVYGFEDTDSENEDDDNGDHASSDLAAYSGGTSSSFLVTFVQAIASDMFDNTFGVVDPGPVGGRRASRIFRRRSLFRPRRAGGKDPNKAADDTPEQVAHSETFVQDSFALQPLQPFEVEDELWENQRWHVKKGWSGSLLRTDRAPYTDRIGRGDYQSLEQYETPKGWKVTSKWQVDLSGQVSGRCGTDGFMYALDFPPLDSDLARGRPKVAKGVRSHVRRRRYFRRRVPERLPRSDPFVIWHGWLGRRSSTTGRWQSRYFVLTRGLRLHGKVTGVALSFFRSEFTEHLELVGSNDLEAWNALTTRQLKTFNFDGAHIISRPDPPPNKMLHFEVRIASQQAILEFVCDSIDGRNNWIAAIEHSVSDQINRFTLTKSLDLGAHGPFANIPQYNNAILDRLLPMPVDDAFELLLFDASFEEEFIKSMKLRIEKREIWSDRRDSGSRRELILASRNRKKPSQIIFKQKLVRCEPGVGYQVDMSLQNPTSAWGNIYQDEIRVVLGDWKSKSARFCVTHRVHLRSEDETVRTYIESSARHQVIEIFSDRLLPILQRTLKERHRREQANKAKRLPLASPSGVAYRVDPNKQRLHAPGYAY